VSARLQKFALIGEKISRRWAFRLFSNKAYPMGSIPEAFLSEKLMI